MFKGGQAVRGLDFECLPFGPGEVREVNPLRDLVRRPYFRPAFLVAMVAGVVGAWAGEASAQFFGGGGFGGMGGGFGGRMGMGGIGAGSTVQGDILRGEGIAAMGFGQYNLSTAMATSINTDTAIRWNQYVYLSLEEDLHKKALHREAHFQRNDANYRKNLERIRTRPDQADLRSGDALNAVLVQLLDPRISPSNYRRAVVQLPGDTIRKIPFQYAQRAATFSMDRLIGKRDWPLRLRDPEFASFRKAYERAVDHAIELDVEGKLTSEAVREVHKAVQDFEIKVEQVIPQSNVDDFNQAKNYLKRLGDIPRMLNERAIERVIAEIETYPGTSVGDLIMFMQKHNLRFGVADSPLENELYASLFDNLAQQRDQVALPPEPDQPIK
jgi:hypothetical protein